MSISYEGIGEWCATFVCGVVSEGDIVKVSANGTVGKCTAGVQPDERHRPDARRGARRRA